jgi:hypothetical protein
MKKLGLVLVMSFAFMVGAAGGSESFTSAANKYCSSYSYWSTCTNTTTNNVRDYTVYRGDTNRKVSGGKIEFSSSHYSSSTWSPNYGSSAFYTAHWIESGGTTYSNTSIWGKSVINNNFYLSNNAPALYSPEVTTQIQNATGDVTWAVNYW